jgi:SAM-dependent methyltransferase
MGLTAPAAERNKGFILDVLRRVLPERGLVLEIASGTGQHVAYLAGELPGLTWQPSEPNPSMRVSIAEWIAETGAPNVLDPVALDVRDETWPVQGADAVLCINMIHIAPWEASLGLMRGAAGVLEDGGVLVLYGPYRRFRRHTAASNEAFDAKLRSEDPAWGVRDLEAVVEAAAGNGLVLAETVEMPANNLTVVFRREAGLAAGPGSGNAGR